MSRAITGRDAMIAAMQPRLDQQYWRFVSVLPDTASILLGSAIGTFREDEGVSAIVPSSVAEEARQAGPDFRRIVLQVRSNLEGVGLTAAVATVLADAGIACNVVAALHHDHVFVPAARSDEALAQLEALSADVRGA